VVAPYSPLSCRIGQICFPGQISYKVGLLNQALVSFSLVSVEYILIVFLHSCLVFVFFLAFVFIVLVSVK